MNNYLLFFIALIPIVWLMVSLGVLKMSGHKTCSITLVITLILAVLVWKMPISQALTATLEGAALAIWPIILVIIAAVFTYNLSIYTKSMDVIKNMMVGITTDKRILVLIVELISSPIEVPSIVAIGIFRLDKKSLNFSVK